MLGTYFTFPELLLWIPLVTGLIAVFIKDAKIVKAFALLSSLATLLVSVISLCYTDVAHHPEFINYNNVTYVWMPYIGSSFSVGLDGMGFLLTFLTAFAFPLIFTVTNKSEYKNTNAFVGMNAFITGWNDGRFRCYWMHYSFISFWELALIPVYFLCSRWGGEKRILPPSNFSYIPFLVLLLMLVGIIYVYMHTPSVSPDSAHSFSINAFYNTLLSPTTGLVILAFLYCLCN